MEAVRSQALDLAVASAPLPGQPDSGDRHLVQPFPNGVLLGVLDGLGHGKEAAQASELAIATLTRNPQESVITLFRQCHQALRASRGVVMTLASINFSLETVTWLGVGNVESILLRADSQATPAYESPILRAGVVGGHLPNLRATIVPIMRGDKLIFATDGIAGGFAPGQVNLSLPPQKIADHILAHHRKPTDDALVLVAHFLGQAYG